MSEAGQAQQEESQDRFYSPQPHFSRRKLLTMIPSAPSTAPKPYQSIIIKILSLTNVGTRHPTYMCRERQSQNTSPKPSIVEQCNNGDTEYDIMCFLRQGGAIPHRIVAEPFAFSRRNQRHTISHSITHHLGVKIEVLGRS